VAFRSTQTNTYFSVIGKMVKGNKNKNENNIRVNKPTEVAHERNTF